MVTWSPRSLRSLPRLDAVRPLPRLEATPPVTKRCLVVRDLPFAADGKKDAPVVDMGRPPQGAGQTADNPRATRITAGPAAPWRGAPEMTCEVADYDHSLESRITGRCLLPLTPADGMITRSCCWSSSIKARA